MFKSTRHATQGASLVEMAMLLPLLILILVGIADLGRAFHDFIVINNASREGARYASHFPDLEANIKQATVDEALSSGVPLTLTQVTVGGLNAAQGNPITVTVRYPFRPIFTRIIGKTVITMTARTQMVVFGYDQ